MKLRILLITVLAITGIVVYGQNIIQGYILDKQTSKPLPYATIVDLHQQYGSYADSSGLFTINFLNESDSLSVSHLGYKRLYTNVRNLQRSSKILLIPDQLQLREVVVKPKKNKTKEMGIGYFTNKPNTFLVPSYTIGLYSTFIPFPKNSINVLFKSVKFTYSTAVRNFPLRVHILTAKTNGEPGDDIISEVIVFNDYKLGLNQVAVIDISKYNVFMPRNGVFIALEWIMDRTQLTLKEAGTNGPYIGAIIAGKSSNSEWYINYYQPKLRKDQSRNILDLGLTVVNYSEK
jgi:hypothetical protein